MLCCYHASCTDGLVSAWIVQLFNKAVAADIRFVPCAYGGATPEVIEGEVVFIVDFSFDAEVMVEMCKKAKTVVLIDHHDSAIAKVWKYFKTNPIPNNLELRLNEDLSGAGGTWNFFYPDTTMPLMVALAQDYDLWKFAYPDTRAFIAGIKGLPPTFATLDYAHGNMPEVIKLGQPFVDKEDEMIKIHLKDTTLVEFEGYTVPIANVPRYIHSLAGHEMGEGYPFAITYYDDGKDRIFSLRSHKGYGLIVNKFAEKRGGGGHPHSAGFRVSLPDNEILKLAKYNE